MKRLLILLLPATFIGLVIVEVVLYGTGFPGKTLWDWLDLLIVPAALALGGYFIQRSERAKADDRLKEQALQDYLDRISEMLLRGQFDNLDTTSSKERARTVARAHTLTVLRSLDSGRKAAVIRFLSEAGLITSDSGTIDEKPAIDLSTADLRETELSRVQLRHVNLQEAHLEAAHLEVADLGSADLTGAHLEKAHLEAAILSWADLHGAHLEGAHLKDASLEITHLEGANLQGAEITPKQYEAGCLDSYTILPDGSHYERSTPTPPDCYR